MASVTKHLIPPGSLRPIISALINASGAVHL